MAMLLIFKYVGVSFYSAKASASADRGEISLVKASEKLCTPQTGRLS